MAKQIKVAAVLDDSGVKKGVKSVSGELDKLGASATGAGSKLKGNLTSALTDVTGKGGTATKALGSLTGGLGGMTVPLLAAGGAITAFALGGAAKIGALGEDIEKFKTVAGVPADVASRWVAVADDFGVSAETIGGAVGKLGKGLGANSALLDQYGVSIVRAKDGSIDLAATTFNVIDAYNATTDPAKKAALGSAAFGKSYQELIPLIDEGSQKIKASFEDVSKAQLFDEKKVKQAKDYRLAMDDLHDTLTDLQMNLGQKVIPIIIETADTVGKLSDAFTWLSDHLPSGAFDKLTAVLNPAGFAFSGVRTKAAELADDLTHYDEMKPGDKWIIGMVEKLPGVSSLAHASTDVVVEGMGEIGNSSVRAASETEQVYLAFLNARGSAQKMTDALDKNVGASKDVVAAYREQQQALKDLQDAQHGTTDAALAAQEADLAAADSIDTYNKSLTDGKLTAREHKQAFIDVQQSIFDTSETYANYVVEQEKGAGKIVTATQETTIRNQAQVVSLQTLQATVKPGSDLWNAIQAYIDHLNAIPKSVYTNVDTTISGNAAGARIGKRAGGGPVSAGTPYWIGENRQPELFVPDQDGRVLTVNQIAAGRATGGGAGHTVTAPAPRAPAPTGAPGTVNGRYTASDYVFVPGDQYASSSMRSHGKTWDEAAKYSINVNVPVGADKAMTGLVIVEAIKAYERTSGSAWRS